MPNLAINVDVFAYIYVLLVKNWCSPLLLCLLDVGFLVHSSLPSGHYAFFHDVGIPIFVFFLHYGQVKFQINQVAIFVVFILNRGETYATFGNDFAQIFLGRNIIDQK